MPEADAGPLIRRQGLAGHVLRFLVQDVGHALRTGHGGLQLAVDLGQLIDGAAELLGVDNEGGNHAHRDHAVHGEVSAEGRDDDEPDVADAVHDGAHDAAEDVRADARFGQGIGGLAEGAGGHVLMVVGHHRAVAGDHFLHRAVQLAQEHLSLAGELAHVPGEDPGGHQRQDHRGAAEQRQLPAVAEHDRHRARDGQHAGEQRRQGLGDCGGDVLDIVGHAAHHVAMGVGIQVAHGKIHHPAEQLLAQLADDPLAQVRADEPLQQLAAAVHQVHQQHPTNRPAQAAHGFPGDHIDGPALQAGGVHAAHRAQNHRRQHAQHHGLLPGKVDDHAPERGAHVFRVLHLGEARAPVHAGDGALHQLLISHAAHPPLPSANRRCPGRSCRWPTAPHGCRRRLRGRPPAP